VKTGTPKPKAQSVKPKKWPENMVVQHSRESFDWADLFRVDDQLSEEERLVMQL
jgi:hypothetical protein